MTPENAIDRKPTEYRLLDHNDEIRESDQFDDDGEWASIAQYSWFIGNHWNTALKPMRRKIERL